MNAKWTYGIVLMLLLLWGCATPPPPQPTQLAPLPDGWASIAGTGVPGLYAETLEDANYDKALSTLTTDCMRRGLHVAFEFQRGEVTYSGDIASLVNDRAQIYISDTVTTVVRESAQFDAKRSDPQSCKVYAKVQRHVRRLTHAKLRASPLLRATLDHEGPRTTDEILGYRARCVHFSVYHPGVRCVSIAADRSKGLLLFDGIVSTHGTYAVTVLMANVLIDASLFEARQR